MRRHAFTTLELLVAITLLLALAGLTFPVLVASLTRETLDASGEQAAAAIQSARAIAQRESSVLEVRARFEQGRTRLVVALLESPPELDASLEAPLEPAPGTLAFESPTRAPLLESVLPEGVRLSLRPPWEQVDPLAEEWLDSRAAPGDSPAESDPFAPEGGDVFLGLVMPDGSCDLVPAFLFLKPDQAVRLTAPRWLGTPAIERVAPPIDDLEGFEPEPAGNSP